MDYLQKVENPSYFLSIPRRKTFTNEQKSENFSNLSQSPNIQVMKPRISYLNESILKPSPQKTLDEQSIAPQTTRRKQKIMEIRIAQSPDTTKRRRIFNSPKVSRLSNDKLVPLIDLKQQGKTHSKIADEFKIEKFLQAMHEGCYPDFGFVNELTFSDNKPGWHLFLDILSGYPKYQKLAKHIQELRLNKQKKEEAILRMNQVNQKMLRTNHILKTKASLEAPRPSSLNLSPIQVHDSPTAGFKSSTKLSEDILQQCAQAAFQEESSPKSKKASLSQKRYLQQKEQYSQKFDQFFEAIEQMKIEIETNRVANHKIAGRHSQTPSLIQSPNTGGDSPIELKKELKRYQIKAINFSPIRSPKRLNWQTDTQPLENQTTQEGPVTALIKERLEEESKPLDIANKSSSFIQCQFPQQETYSQSQKTSPQTIKKSSLVTRISLKSRSLSLCLRLKNIIERVKTGNSSQDKETNILKMKKWLSILKKGQWRQLEYESLDFLDLGDYKKMKEDLERFVRDIRSFEEQAAQETNQCAQDLSNQKETISIFTFEDNQESQQEKSYDSSRFSIRLSKTPCKVSPALDLKSSNLKHAKAFLSQKTSQNPNSRKMTEPLKPIYEQTKVLSQKGESDSPSGSTTAVLPRGLSLWQRSPKSKELQKRFMVMEQNNQVRLKNRSADKSRTTLLPSQTPDLQNINNVLMNFSNEGTDKLRKNEARSYYQNINEVQLPPEYLSSVEKQQAISLNEMKKIKRNQIFMGQTNEEI